MRKLLKSGLRVIFKLLNLPFLLLYFALASLPINKNALFASFSQFYSLWPGKIGIYMRAAFYQSIFPNTATNIEVGFATLFSQIQTEIGRSVYIGPQCNIGSCKIEADCLIGSGVHILSGKGQHNFTDIETPVREQGGQFEQINIGEDCWIGNQAIIMASIGKKCVVAAGSVVVNSVPDFSIVAGNPAKVIKTRRGIETAD
ncbi:acyltransferase [Gayadomonas joobiniege]|uniref:acyltransferase n=1 Tax=Gayadomonas joobiniege TaxID=1234606 RepID=UPI000376CFFE|nr:acyltransferase [Gayadomonas joobiniege]